MNIHSLFSKKDRQKQSAQQDQAEIPRLEKLVAEMQEQLAGKDLLLENAGRELARKDEIIARKDMELAEKEQTISLINVRLTEKDRKIKSLEEEINKNAAFLDWLKRQEFGPKSNRTSTLDTIDGQLRMVFPDLYTDSRMPLDKDALPPEESAAQDAASLPLSPDRDMDDPADPACGPAAEKKACDKDVPAAPLPPEVLLVEEEIQEGCKVRVDSYTRTTGRKVTPKTTFKEITDRLPHKKILVPATDEQRTCPECGEEMEHLGWEEIRTEIVVQPAKYEAHVYYAETLKCGHCSDDENSVIVKTNNVPPAVIPRSLASPSLIADNAIMKYDLSVPCYRLERYLLYQGLFKMSRTTMANQMIYVCVNYLVVMYEWLHTELKKRVIINADETPGKVNLFKELVPWVDENGNLPATKEREAKQAVLDKKAKAESEDGKLHQKKIYMWLYASRYGTDHPIDMYDYQPSRAGDCCAHFLGEDYSGYLMVDGYSGYNIMKEATRCNCIAHFRAYWYEAIKTKQGNLDKKDPAVVGFLFSNRLFQVERNITETDPQERHKIRAEKEKPLWKWFWEWQDGIEASGGSPLYKALVYARNHRDLLENYMLDGNIPMTNVRAELLARNYATGRKNYYFHESAEGARSAAILMTLIETAKANKLNPELYLTELLECRLEYVRDPDRRAEFAPWSERMQAVCKKPENDTAEPRVK